MVPPYRWHLSYTICLTINFLLKGLTNLAYLWSCFSKSLNFVLKSITDSPSVTTLSFQHSLYSQRCTSISLNCPYNIIQSGRPIITPQPPPTSPSPPTKQPGELIAIIEIVFFFFSIY